ncbi:MAG: hypothetical protein US83_C0001G0056 [Candidatus Falkowbacteria bacterium GW2011_GWC2_38_22]|uniref:Uncharacterized protein n=1 Tax=Candidatus Falkowbacteria bacterium GW2011_GWE1_38_31 TaxID=1618638 RepID=A0A0G0JWF9_9BACT|nr:MAG: hypothetical protein US73_C0004G0072 [Candidatus Falkowbacteria bacterium GW2011_GWF2_38_1205]KKQ62122.1 MAG: hypothetical protein US83_C0001G0056 [Candidatus Falkowbacteria bacterium GW2011_GWC2_38_22]KKQ64272.1 MAG: hypothetical protein US84_C0001G0056 [Candidatus Falkowbacteria bacterium GW2011_GWF1_38_22]KKQ66249.1 MAG: hypothetical protein US87_C0002G0056 [Candidatus Falkowbacteria bacterium GW2011_GWE2_38_254]KKQ70977.1 MAG: hypothetical protein US91_C0002G0056 [Candidatus Falkowb
MEKYFEKIQNLSFIPTKEKLKWDDNTIGDQFVFKFPDGSTREHGEAQIIYETIDEIDKSDIQSILFKNGLQSKDIIAHLNQFYPNGHGPDEKTEENMKKGIGSEVLEYLMQEAISQGAKAMRTFTGNESMRRFLTKKGFEAIDKSKHRWFKMLT